MKNKLLSLVSGAALLASVGNSHSEETNNPSYFGSANLTLAKEYNASCGFRRIGGDGPVLQGQLTYGANNVFTKDDSLSAFTWSNIELGKRPKSNPWTENDIGVNYSRPIADIAGGKLSLDLSAQLWIYPNNVLGNYDYVTDAGFTWVGPFVAKITHRDLYPHDQIHYGNYTTVGVGSKTVNMRKFGSWDLVGSDSADVTYAHKFFNDRSSLCVQRSTLTLSLINKKKDLQFDVTGGYQFNLDGDKAKSDTAIWSVSATKSF